MQNLKTNGYYDLNIHESCFQREDVDNFLKNLYSFGYRTIAINHVLEDTNLESKKKNKKGEPREPLDCVPEPYDVSNLVRTALNLGLNNLTILNRLTIVFSNQAHLHKITKSPNYKKFDIIGVIPVTHTAFVFTCSNLEADIFSYDPQNRFTFKLKRKLYSQLLDRGFHFELLYGPAVEDSTKRRNMINLAHQYHTFGKSKNVIFSSGAEHHHLIRNAYDIISLGPLFGLNQLQSKNAIDFCPHNVIINAVGRRHGKSVMLIENVEMEADINPLVIADSPDEEMDVEGPSQKKTKPLTDEKPILISP